MLHSQDLFHELEQILRSLQENFEPGSKAISTDPAPHNVSDEKTADKGPKKLQEIPVFKVEFHGTKKRIYRTSKVKSNGR